MIPFSPEVYDWLLGVFSHCNSRVSNMMTRNPNVHEETLDQKLISELDEYATPHSFSGGWTVNIETHWLGNFPLYYEEGRRRGWEIADIGVLVVFSTAGHLVRSKIALLQSKRLFAIENAPEPDDDFFDRHFRGMRGLLPTDDKLNALKAPRSFTFTGESQYLSLEPQSRQYKSIKEYQARQQVPVYYLFYNPLGGPHTATVPMSGGAVAVEFTAGCRVVISAALDAAIIAVGTDESPRYSTIQTIHADGVDGGWPLERFVVDRLLQCKDGRRFDDLNDPYLDGALYNRTRPIVASVAVTIDGPAGFDWTVMPDTPSA